MKKLLSAICLILFLSAAGGTVARAQSPVKFGIRGGVNFATLNNVDDVDSRTGLMAGAYLNFKVPMSPVSIQPEVLYTQKGAEASNADATLKLDYIEVPVLAKFDFVTSGPVTPNVYFGPYVGFNINAEGQVSGNGGSISGDIKDQIKDTDFGVVVGGGIDVSKLNIGIRYGAGLTKVFEDDSDGKNGVFSIVAGISL